MRLRNPQSIWSARFVISLAIIGALGFIALFADALSPFPHDRICGKAFLPPLTDGHLLGTDDLSYDIWAQICHGARISLSVGMTVAIISTIIGGVAGIAAAYYGGWVDRLLMTVGNIFMSVPDVVIIIILVAFWGQSTAIIITAITLFSWTSTARIIRSRALSLKELYYVKMAKCYKAGFFHILKEHMLPELWPLWVTSFIKLVGRAVMMEATMSFLGLGDPTSKSWGVILNNALNYRGIYYTDYWKWWIVPPVLALILLVTSLASICAEIERVTIKKGAI